MYGYCSVIAYMSAINILRSRTNSENDLGKTQ